METAHYDVLKRDIFNKVYEPAEDSFLLLDAIENELDFIKSLRPGICLEVGSGSGVVLTTIAKALGSSFYYLATDINPDAAIATKLVANRNNVEIEVICTSFTEALVARLNKSIDLLLFNPPYVVTPEEEVHGDQLQLAVAGGNRGCQVINAFLKTVPLILKKSGLLYLVCIKENDPVGLCHALKHHGISGKVALSRRCGIEMLYVLRFSYSSEATVKDKA